MNQNSVTYDRGNDVFRGTLIQVVKLAMRAVQDLGWKIDQVNETLGLVNFTTGMSWGSWSGVSGTLNIDEDGAGGFKVTGTGKQNISGGQLLAINLFNEAQGKAQKAINRMKELAV